MRVIPVIDLKDGIAVHAIGGNRDQYLPVRSCIGSADPKELAEAFSQLGLCEIYVADLDAIAGGEPQVNAYAAVAHSGVSLWLDSGIGDRPRAQHIAELTTQLNCGGVIAGLESVASLEVLAHILDVVGCDRLVFSLDMKHGLPYTSSPSWRDQSGLEIAHAVCALGIRRFIVLDLADVGTGQGTSTLKLCQQLRASAPKGTELVAGGGVRHAGDLQVLARAGCDGALVATALHDASITRDGLAQFALGEGEGLVPADVIKSRAGADTAVFRNLRPLRGPLF